MTEVVQDRTGLMHKLGSTGQMDLNGDRQT